MSEHPEKMTHSKMEEVREVNEDDEEDDEGEEEEVDSKEPFEGAYDPADYDNLRVSPEIKSLFNYITAYTPQTAELEVKLKPFILDYIPAVGDTDPFVKIPRPDRVDDELGLVVLDEPECLRDPALVKLQLIALGKDVLLDDQNKESDDTVKVATSNRDIDSWIQSITQLHQETSAGGSAMTLVNSQRLPDLEILMQEWPPGVEEALDRYEIPPPETDCDLEQYINMVCGILDIPIHNSKITSLYLLFSLYNEFKNSQHFKEF